MVNKMGMATLCANKADAQQEAADAQSLWPDMGPHRAVQLVEAAQQESFDRSPQATSIEEAARDVGKWLNERPNRPIDLRHVAMLCAHATAAHQQEAQEPVACEPLIRQMRNALSLPCDRWNATQSRIVREAIAAADAWLEGN